MLIPSSHNFSMFVGCLVASHLTYDPHHSVPNEGYIARLLALDSRIVFIVHVPSTIYVWIGKISNSLYL